MSETLGYESSDTQQRSEAFATQRRLARCALGIAIAATPLVTLPLAKSWDFLARYVLHLDMSGNVRFAGKAMLLIGLPIASCLLTLASCDIISRWDRRKLPHIKTASWINFWSIFAYIVIIFIKINNGWLSL